MVERRVLTRDVALVSSEVGGPCAQARNAHFPLHRNHFPRSNRRRPSTAPLDPTPATPNTPRRDHGCRQEQASFQGKEGSQEEDRSLRQEGLVQREGSRNFPGQRVSCLQLSPLLLFRSRHCMLKTCLSTVSVRLS